MESQHDKLLHLMYQLIDFHIDTLANDTTYGVDVLDPYASHRIPGMPMKAHLLKRELGNLKGKRITCLVQLELPKG